MLRAMMRAWLARRRDQHDAGPERFLDDRRSIRLVRGGGARAFTYPPSLAGWRSASAYYLNNLSKSLETTFGGASHLRRREERFPRLNICLVHGGGLLPYNVGRLRRGRLVRAETAVAMSGSVEDSYRRFLFDTVTHSVPALRFLAQEAGAERVLLGSDYPFDMGDPDPIATVRDARFEASEEELITRRNAERLLRAEAS